MTVAKLNNALEAALVFLGRSQDTARFRLKDILVEEVSFVDRAANRRRFLVVKRKGDGMAEHQPPEELTVVEQAVWSTEYVNDLPDSAFMFIEEGGELDDEGKTVPRTLRHFPIRDAEGNLDEPHVRNAIARIPQSTAEGLTDEKKTELQEAARELLAELQGEGTGEGEAEDAAEKASELTLTQAARDDLLLEMAIALEQLVDLSEVVRSAKCVESGDPPQSVGARLSEIGGLLQLSGSRYSEPVSNPAETREQSMNIEKGDPTISRELNEISEAATALSADAAKAEDLGPDFVVGLRQLAAHLNKLTEAIPQPAAAAAPEDNPAEAATEEKAEPEQAEVATEEKAEPETDPEPVEAATEEKADPEQAEAAEGEGERREVTLEEMDEKLVPMGSEAADKLKVLGEAMIEIARIDNPEDLVLFRDKLIKAEADFSAQIEKGTDGAEKLGKILGFIRQAIAVIDDAGAPPAPPAAADAAAPPADATAKGISETQPLSPPDEDGGPGTVGKGPAQDRPAAESSDELGQILKSMAAMQAKIEKLAGTPQTPASRSESVTRGPSAPSNGVRRSVRGGPWVL